MEPSGTRLKQIAARDPVSYVRHRAVEEWIPMAHWLGETWQSYCGRTKRMRGTLLAGLRDFTERED